MSVRVQAHSSSCGGLIDRQFFLSLSSTGMVLKVCGNQLLVMYQILINLFEYIFSNFGFIISKKEFWAAINEVLNPLSKVLSRKLYYTYMTPLKELFAYFLYHISIIIIIIYFIMLVLFCYILFGTCRQTHCQKLCSNQVITQVTCNY